MGTAETSEAVGRKLVVIYNPVKVGDEDEFTEAVRRAARSFGWDAPEFSPTTEDDPGYAMAQAAVDAHADLVIAAGGDGTVRVVSTELRETDVCCAILPMGTGNLLARNLEIPLDIEDALEVALTGEPRTLDLARLVVDHGEAVYFTGMAGVGFDAALMDDTDENLKKVAGAIAYVVSFAKQLGAPARRVRVRVDDRIRLRRRAVLILVGNTSSLHGGVQLFPDATPDDGELDLLLAEPRTLGGWARLFHVIVQKIRRTKTVAYYSGRHIVVDLDEAAPWELDGDTEGTGRHFEFEVVPDALRVITARRAAGEAQD